MLKKTISVFLVVLVMLSALAVLPTVSFAVPAVVGSGSCGTQATWTLTDDGTLTISGKGAVSWPMTEEVYNEETGETETRDLPVPWDAALDSLICSRLGYASMEDANAALERGDLKLGDFFYTQMRSIRAVMIEEGITSIPDNSFLSYDPVIISLPSTMQTLPEHAFSYVLLKDLYLHNPDMDTSSIEVFAAHGETTIKSYEQWADYFTASFVLFSVQMMWLYSAFDSSLDAAFEPYSTVLSLVSALRLLYDNELNAAENYKTQVECLGVSEEAAAGEQRQALSVAVEDAHNILRDERFADLREIQEIGALKEAIRTKINGYLQKDFSLEEMFDRKESQLWISETYAETHYDLENSDALKDAVEGLLYVTPKETVETKTVKLGETTEDAPFPWITIHAERDSAVQAAAERTGVRFVSLGASDEKPADENVCSWCGKTHEGFFQRIVAFFHRILARLFGSRF